MLEPPQRSSLWRVRPWKKDKTFPKNLDDYGLNCGGFWVCIVKSLLSMETKIIFQNGFVYCSTKGIIQIPKYCKYTYFIKQYVYSHLTLKLLSHWNIFSLYTCTTFYTCSFQREIEGWVCRVESLPFSQRPRNPYSKFLDRPGLLHDWILYLDIIIFLFCSNWKMIALAVSVSVRLS